MASRWLADGLRSATTSSAESFKVHFRRNNREIFERDVTEGTVPSDLELYRPVE